jgi:hypothetical protein
VNWTLLGHMVVALAAIGATAVLAAMGVIPAADFLAVLSSILVGTGVSIGAVLASPPPVNPPSLAVTPVKSTGAQSV